MNLTPYEQAFFDTIAALGQEHLNNLIVVGGWCPYLYAKHVWKREAPEIMTIDVDFAVKKMAPDNFSIPVYKRLLQANLTPRKMDMDDENKVQFAYIAGKMVIPIEFITSPNVLPRGQRSKSTPYVTCDPVPEVAIALQMPSLRQDVSYKGESFSLNIMSPAAFIVVKSLLLEHRVNSQKLPRDLASIAFVLRYAPKIDNVLKDIALFGNTPAVREAGKILNSFVGDESQKGFLMLREFFDRWGVTKDQISNQIINTFAPLQDVLSDRSIDRTV